MPEQTNNDAPGADRPSARPGQETPPRTGEAERTAREAVERVAGGSTAPRDAGKS